MTTIQGKDYEGSYLLGEADGEIWTRHGHPNDAQSLSLLSPEDIGQRDMFGQDTASWLQDKAEAYGGQDQNFASDAYYEGFLSAVRRFRDMRSFAVAGSMNRW